ncbi:MAG: hypothetical protein ACNYNY_00720 [Candidatus Oxydemutatoraceae bacterium WSBS_2016_MAG_OTU14]
MQRPIQSICILGDGTDGSVEASAAVTVTEHTFTNLNFGSSYTLEVIAMGSAEDYRNSVPSTTSAMTTRQALPTPEITLTVISSVNISVSWENPPTEVEEYVISIMPGTEEARRLNVHTSTETIFRNLSAGVYTIEEKELQVHV